MKVKNHPIETATISENATANCVNIINHWYSLINAFEVLCFHYFLLQTVCYHDLSYLKEITTYQTIMKYQTIIAFAFEKEGNAPRHWWIARYFYWISSFFPVSLFIWRIFNENKIITINALVCEHNETII